jgi:hypothetical protein
MKHPGWVEIVAILQESCRRWQQTTPMSTFVVTPGRDEICGLGGAGGKEGVRDGNCQLKINKGQPLPTAKEMSIYKMRVLSKFI